MRYLLATLLLVGCTSLHTEISENIQYNDSLERVKWVLGSPDEERGAVWVYTRRSETCEIGIYQEKVSSVSCSRDGSYRNPIITWTAAILGGMGRGLSKAPPPEPATECESTIDGNTIHTSCNK
jgi:hypothetical protein